MNDKNLNMSHVFAIYRLRYLILPVMIILLIKPTDVKAQQEPLYTQYMFNTVSVNPAYTGTRNAMNLFLLSRLQWAGLEGAPKTTVFSMHTPFNSYKMGVGFSITTDNIGPVNNTYFSASYAYRVNLNEKMTLSLGLKGGFYNYYAGLMDVPTNEPTDPSFYGNLEKKFQPNAGAGVYLYTDKFYAGFSVPKLLQTELGDYEYNGSVLNELRRHYFIMAGYVFNISSDLKFKPSFIEKIVEGAPPSTDLTAQFLLKDTYWFGVTYRVKDAVAFIANIQINKQLMVGYSYDISTSHLATYNNGSHEIVISYDFDGFMKNKVKSPRYF